MMPAREAVQPEQYDPVAWDEKKKRLVAMTLDDETFSFIIFLCSGSSNQITTPPVRRYS